jgi:predicted ATPase
MLTRLHVAGFKSLRAATVKLGTVNVFIGANGSGKSNLLEALGVAGAAAFGAVEPEALRYRGVRPGLPALYKSSFAGERIRRIISIECESEKALYRVGLDNPIRGNDPGAWRISSEWLESAGQEILTRSPRGARVYTSTGPLRFRAAPRETAARTALQAADEPKAARELLDRLVAYAVYNPATAVLRGLQRDVARPPLGLSGGGLPLAVRDLISRREGRFGPFDLEEIWELIDWAEDVQAVSSDQATISPAVSTTPTVLRFHDRYMAPSRSTLSAYDASEGALYVLFLLALASHPEAPQTLAVDNFDTALHPRLARQLTRMVCEYVLSDGRRQLLLTTHNPLVLDGLDIRDDRIRLFAVERQRNGESEIRRISLSEEVLEEVDHGMSLSRLWVMGRLGAIPEYL